MNRNANRNIHCVKTNKSPCDLLLWVHFGTTDIVSSLYIRITPTMMDTHACLSYTGITPAMMKHMIILMTDFEMKDWVKPRAPSLIHYGTLYCLYPKYIGEIHCGQILCIRNSHGHVL